MDFSYQLYSARNEKSLDDTLKTLKSLGYTQVEGWGGQFGAPVAIPRGDQQGIDTRANSVAVFATARPIHGFDALGLRCVIEQQMPSEEDIQHAVGGSRRAVA